MHFLILLISTAFTFLGFYTQPANAAASPLVMTPCPKEFGVTKMDIGNVNIIACVCNSIKDCATTGHKDDLVWKSLTKQSNTNNIDCSSKGKYLFGISGGVPICISPKVNVTIVEKNNVTNDPQPPICPAVKILHVDKVGAGGCYGQFNIDLPGGATSGSMELYGDCNKGSNACSTNPTKTCSTDVEYTGTATCSSGKWLCTITKKTTKFEDAVQASSTSVSFANNKACSTIF